MPRRVSPGGPLTGNPCSPGNGPSLPRSGRVWVCEETPELLTSQAFLEMHFCLSTLLGRKINVCGVMGLFLPVQQPGWVTRSCLPPSLPHTAPFTPWQVAPSTGRAGDPHPGSDRAQVRGAARLCLRSQEPWGVSHGAPVAALKLWPVSSTYSWPRRAGAWCVSRPRGDARLCGIRCESSRFGSRAGSRCGWRRGHRCGVRRRRPPSWLLPRPRRPWGRALP